MMRDYPRQRRNLDDLDGPHRALIPGAYGQAARTTATTATTAYRSWPAESLLGRLPAPTRAAFVRLGVPKTYAAGTSIVQLGAPGTCAYLLLDGFVTVTGNDGGREPLLAVRRAGDLIGEMSAISDGVRSATVTARSEISAREIPATVLKQFLKGNGDAMFEVARMSIRRLQWANERRVEFATLSAKDRVVRVLVALAEVYGRDARDLRSLSIPLTQGETASLAGVRLATAEKALHSLQAAGLVRLEYRNILVTDVEQLRLINDS